MDEIRSNSANSDSGHSYNIQRLQSIPHDANSEDVFQYERAIGALEKMTNSSQDITNRLSEKKKNCYLPSIDLVPEGKSTVRYVEVKLQALEEIKGTLFHMLDNVNTVLLAFRRRYNQNTYTKAEEVRTKRIMKERKRKNETKKLKVFSKVG